MSAMSIRLPDSLHEHLKQMAEKEGISMNQFITLPFRNNLNPGLPEKTCSQFQAILAKSRIRNRMNSTGYRLSVPYS